MFQNRNTINNNNIKYEAHRRSTGMVSAIRASGAISLCLALWQMWVSGGLLSRLRFYHRGDGYYLEDASIELDVLGQTMVLALMSGEILRAALLGQMMWRLWPSVWQRLTFMMGNKGVGNGVQGRVSGSGSSLKGRRVGPGQGMFGAFIRKSKPTAVGGTLDETRCCVSICAECFVP
jgi:hypothetical protein